MSVNLMSLVFNCNVPELKTDDGKTVPDTTAKSVLLALADNANDEGEGSYPGVDTLCRKTNYSTSTVCNALNALRHNGFTVLVGRSKRDTNNYTVSVAEILKFQWPKREDSSHRNATVSAVETNPSSTSIKPSVEKRGDLLDGMLELALMPGSKKSVIKQGYAELINQKLVVRPTGKQWEDFINFAADRQIKDGQPLDKFLTWVLANDYNPMFCPPSKLQQLWDRAFTANPSIAKPTQRQRVPSGI